MNFVLNQAKLKEDPDPGFESGKVEQQENSELSVQYLTIVNCKIVKNARQGSVGSRHLMRYWFS